MASEKKNYLVGICCTESDGLILYRVNGTEEQVKQHLVNCVNEDKQNDEDKWDYGDDDIVKILVDPDGTINAYANYMDYHIDYTATPEDAAEIKYL